LELTDIYLWIYKRVMEQGELAPALFPLVRAGMRKITTDEVSLKAISVRWKAYFDRMPELHEMTPEQLAKGKEILAMDESRRLARIGRAQLLSGAADGQSGPSHSP
jgi:hypothetical protein